MTDCLKNMDREEENRYTENQRGGQRMEVEIRVEPGRQEPKIVILAGEESEELRRLAE